MHPPASGGRGRLFREWPKGEGMSGEGSQALDCHAPPQDAEEPEDEYQSEAEPEPNTESDLIRARMELDSVEEARTEMANEVRDLSERLLEADGLLQQQQHSESKLASEVISVLTERDELHATLEGTRRELHRHSEGRRRSGAQLAVLASQKEALERRLASALAEASPGCPMTACVFSSQGCKMLARSGAGSRMTSCL